MTTTTASLRAAGSANPSHHAAIVRRRAGPVFVVILVIVMFLNYRGGKSLDNSAVYAPASVAYDSKYDDAHADLAKSDTHIGHAVQRHRTLDASVEEKYCNMTNPPADRMANEISCLTSDGGFVKSMTDDAFVLVATVAEDSFWNASSGRCDVGHLSWMASLSFPLVVFVKSNATRSFRQSHNAWTTENHYNVRSREKMHFPLNAAQPSTTFTTFRSVLRDAWEAAQQPLADDAAPTAPLCSGSKWMTEKQQSMSDLFIFESPNVGDEALSMVEIALRMSRVAAKDTTSADDGRVISEEDRIKLLSLDSILAKVQYVIAVHDHASSWHSLRLVEQLQCLCMDNKRPERYRTLTTPAKAYLLQCMPLEVNTTESLVQVLSRVPPAAARNAEFIAFQTKTIHRSAALSTLFQHAIRYLFTVDSRPRITRWPAAVVRDCCATFVVSRDAIIGTDLATGWPMLVSGGSATASQVWNSLSLKIQEQPLHVDEYFTARKLTSADEELRVGELSMYLERFWRTIFGATEYETQRDLAVLHCADAKGIAFDCPPFSPVAGVDDLLAEVSKDVLSGRLRCDAPFAAQNLFRNPEK
jgi:hypothetical protein